MLSSGPPAVASYLVRRRLHPGQYSHFAVDGAPNFRTEVVAEIARSSAHVPIGQPTLSSHLKRISTLSSIGFDWFDVVFCSRSSKP